MTDVLAITGPIYLCIALGYATTRAGLFARAEMRTLGKFVINLGLPALLFNALATRPIEDLLHADYLLVYALVSLTSALAGLYWYRRLRQEALTPSVVSAMGMSCSNSGFVGYPIMLLTFPDIAGVALALHMVVENMVLIPLLMALAERGQGQAKPWQQVARDTVRSLLTNPMVLGVLLGMLFSAMQWQLAAPVARTVNLLALSSSALALFVIGGSLLGLRVQGIVGRVLPIAAGKLVLHPLLAAGALYLLPLLGGQTMDPALAKALVLACAMPMMGIYPVLAQRFGMEDLAAASLLFTTIASFFTLNLALWLLA